MKQENHNQKLPDWNRDEVWNRVEQRLDKKERKGFFFWWWIGGCAALLVGALAVFNWTAGTDDFSLSGNEMEQIRVQIQESNSNSTSNSNFNSNSDSNLDDNSTTTNSKNTTTNSEKGRQQLAEAKINKTPSIEKTISTAISNIPPNNYPSRWLSGEGVPEGRGWNEEELTKLIPPPLSPSEGGQFSGGKTMVAELKVLVNEINYLEWEPAPINFSVSHISTKVEKIEKQKSQKSNWLFFAESGISGGSVIHLADTETYRLAREKSQQFRFATGVNLGVEYDLPKNWYLRSSVDFKAYFELYDRTASFTTNEQVLGDSASYVLNDGLVYLQPGNVQQTTTVTRSIVNNNFLYRLSVPVSVGRRFNLKQWQVSADLGVKPRVAQHFQGVIASIDDYHLFDEPSINADYYSDFDLGMVANLSLRYPLSRNMQLGISTRFEKDDILNLNFDDSESKYSLWGGHLGVYWNL